MIGTASVKLRGDDIKSPERDAVAMATDIVKCSVLWLSHQTRQRERCEAQTGGKQAEEKSETLQTVNKFVVPSVWQRSDATRVQANDRMKGTVF